MIRCLRRICGFLLGLLLPHRHQIARVTLSNNKKATSIVLCSRVTIKTIGCVTAATSPLARLVNNVNNRFCFTVAHEHKQQTSEFGVCADA